MFRWSWLALPLLLGCANPRTGSPGPVAGADMGSAMTPVPPPDAPGAEAPPADGAAPLAPDALVDVPPIGMDSAVVEAAGPEAPAGGGSGLTAGWTQRTFMFRHEGPWNLGPTARYSHDASSGTHSLWVEMGDAAPVQGSTRDPGSEMRWTSEYTSGENMFDADVWIDPASHATGILQIKPSSGNPPTAIILTAWQDGTVRHYFGTGTGPVVKQNALGVWWNLKVVHNVTTNEIKIYVDDMPAGTFPGRSTGGWYFTNGVYATRSARSETRWRNIRYWVR
jgi:hypothetical protein